MLRRFGFVAAMAGVCALAAASIHAQNSPLMVTGGWTPVAAVAMALPSPMATYRDELAAQTYDRALLAALRGAMAGEPVQVAYSRDGTGRYFIAVTDLAAMATTLANMQRIARVGPPDRLVDEAAAGIGSDLAFRGDLPRSQFDRVLGAHLKGVADAADFVIEPVAAEGLAEQARAMVAFPPWGPPVWVVVGDQSVTSASTAGPGRPDPAAPAAAIAQPLYVTSATQAGSEPLRVEIPSDGVTRWVGSVFRFPPETTLLEAVVLRLVLQETLKALRDPNLFELATEIDALGRLVVSFSTSIGASLRWESRLDDAISELAEGTGVRLNQSHRPARSRWSQQLSSPSGVARAAAEALLRGASDSQAKAFARGTAEVPDTSRIGTVAKGISLSIRVVYGTD